MSTAIIIYIVFWSAVVIIGAAIWHNNAKSNGHKSTFGDKFLKMFLIWIIAVIFALCSKSLGGFGDDVDITDIQHVHGD